MIIEEEIIFDATPEQVWKLLIDPKFTRQYMFGCEIVSEWKIGSDFLWNGKTEDGKEICYVSGKLLAYEEGKILRCSMFDPNSDMEDIQQNYVNLSYQISTSDKSTKLKVIQGDFQGAANGPKRYEESKSGWQEFVIPTMLKLMAAFD